MPAWIGCGEAPELMVCAAVDLRHCRTEFVQLCADVPELLVEEGLASVEFGARHPLLSRDRGDDLAEQCRRGPLEFGRACLAFAADERRRADCDDDCDDDHDRYAQNDDR